MAKPSITSAGAERIKAAHENYVTALREYNSLRCAKPRSGDDPNYTARVADAQTRTKEAYAEWVMLYQQETGRKLAV